MPASDTLRELEPEAEKFYRDALTAIKRSGVPYLVGGAYAFARYTGIVRHTKDFDIFVHPQQVEQVMQVMRDAGYNTDLTFPHWLAKVFHGDNFADLIYASGNGVAVVDDSWFEGAVEDEVLGVRVLLIPPEEMIWSKAYIMERERFDGADILHILRVRADSLDWSRLVRRFGSHWRVLLSHLVLFGFVYPNERHRIPERVMSDLIARLSGELGETGSSELLCQGTLISRAQYLEDIEEWGYRDARLLPSGNMYGKDVSHWTAAIEENK